MADEILSRAHYGETFWRAHHEAWRRSELNQREYCEAQGFSLKAFGNWRAKFKAEPQPPVRKLLDALCDLQQLRTTINSLGSRATLDLIDAADHSFHVPGRSGKTDAEVRGDMIDALQSWIQRSIV